MEKCRRRWDLADAEQLKYKFMQAFDRAMNHLDKAFSFSSASHQYISRKARQSSTLRLGAGSWIMKLPLCIFAFLMRLLDWAIMS